MNLDFWFESFELMWKYLGTFAVGMASLLAGASVVHTVYKPSTQLPIETRLLIAKAEAREAKQGERAR